MQWLIKDGLCLYLQVEVVQEHLLVIQPEFKSDLTAGVEQYIADVNSFVGDYDKT